MTRPHNPIEGFSVDKDALSFLGEGLQRPECILAERDGTLWAADARGGVVRIDADGAQRIITQTHQEAFAGADGDATRFTEGTLPNGLAFAGNGDILIANFGTDVLEVMTREGKTRILHDSIEGKPIGKVNFVLRDSKDRIWLTISTRIKNWMQAISPNYDDGYIALVDRRGIRIVADGLRFTNEIRMDANEDWLYIAETTGKCISRMRVQPDGTLTQREVYGPSDLGVAGFPDGIAFDAYGNLWGTLVMRDQVFAITPKGERHIILDDSNPAPAAALEDAFQRDAVTPDHLLACGGTIAPWFASITFSGKDLRAVCVGSLRGTSIPTFRSPVAGLPMVHW